MLFEKIRKLHYKSKLMLVILKPNSAFLKNTSNEIQVLVSIGWKYFQQGHYYRNISLTLEIFSTKHQYGNEMMKYDPKVRAMPLV